MANHVFVERMVVASARTDLYEWADLHAVLATGRASTRVSRSIVSNRRRLDAEHALVRAGQVRRVGKASLVRGFGP